MWANYLTKYSLNFNCLTNNVVERRNRALKVVSNVKTNIVDYFKALFDFEQDEIRNVLRTHNYNINFSKAYRTNLKDNFSFSIIQSASAFYSSKASQAVIQSVPF